MKVLQVKKSAIVKPGKFYNVKQDWTVLRSLSPVKVVDDTNKIIAIFLPSVINNALQNIGEKLGLLVTYKSDARPDASGLRVKTAFGVKSSPKKSMSKPTIIRGARAPTAVIGYVPRNNFRPCRMSKIYKNNKSFIDLQAAQLVRKLSSLFKKHCPIQYQNQYTYIKSCNPNMVFNGTVFTTLTVNKTWRTAAHIDRSDFPSGLGNLTAFGEWKGGDLLFPQYKLAIRIKPGDVLFFDVHEYHCNSPIHKIDGKERVTLVCYAHKNIAKRCKGIPAAKLMQNSSAMNPSKEID